MKSNTYNPYYIPWKDDIVTAPPVIENGVTKVPCGPGWGTDLNEKEFAKHPPS
tara:strand:+ start:387 stop:545 length:159 start_codon:yes stop_codon:yes gene_type:complete